MGVDYTAFVCWGQRLKGYKGLADLFEQRSSLLKKHRVGYAEYGSRSYGGDGGFILTLDETHHQVDFDDASLAKPIPKDRDWNQVEGISRIQDVVYELRKEHPEVETDGESGWFVCGHVW